jgi:uridine phosphorylase
LRILVGASWTTDAPFWETAEAIEAARAKGVLAVEMEAAALYTHSRGRAANPSYVLRMSPTRRGRPNGILKKGESDGTTDALKVLEIIVKTTM